MVFVFLTSAFVSMFSMQCYADISVYDLQSSQQIGEIFRSVTSSFGPHIDPDGFEVIFYFCVKKFFQTRIFIKKK